SATNPSSPNSPETRPASQTQPSRSLSRELSPSTQPTRQSLLACTGISDVRTPQSSAQLHCAPISYRAATLPALSHPHLLDSRSPAVRDAPRTTPRSTPLPPESSAPIELVREPT